MGLKGKEKIVTIAALALTSIFILSGCVVKVKSQGYIRERPVEMPGPFNKEDMVINSLRVGELTLEDVKATLGEPEISDLNKSKLIKYDGMLLGFTGDKLSKIEIKDSSIEGPRGIKIGDVIENAIGRFPLRTYDEKKTVTPQILYAHKEGSVPEMPFGTIDFKAQGAGVIDYWFCYSGEGKSIKDKNELMGNLKIDFKSGKVTGIKISWIKS